MKSKIQKILLITGVVLVVFVFAFSLFKNIAYPLLWNDEASTAMFGRRVLEYGYPKANDGKNYLYYFNDKDHNIGVKGEGDVYIGEGWVQYYVAAIGDYFAEKTDNIYGKTAAMRTPFAVAGFLAVIIFGLTISQFFKNNKKKAFIAFFLFELISISLVLHLREVRYYSLILLFSAILINVYLRYTVLKNLKYKYYAWIISIFLILLFNTHYPVCIIFMVSLCLFNAIMSYVRSSKNINLFISNFIRLSFPILLSIVLVIPLIIYFDMIPIAKAITNESSLGLSNYINNIFLSFSFFSNFESLYLSLFLGILIFLYFCFNRKILIDRNIEIITGGGFLVLFFNIYILVISGTVFVFERYLVVLQPVLVGIILFEILLLWRVSKTIFNINPFNEKLHKNIFWGIIIISIYMNTIPHMDVIRGHIYELTHRYMGPLDYAIPYIKEKYDDTSKLTIATNYEENSYMYYLDSKTTIGYVGNNIEEDSKIQPDIIVLRKYFIYGQKGYIDIFNNFLDNGDYQAINFPIYDYPFNNIPELNFNASHLFETKFSQNENDKLYLYFKK